MRTKKFEKKLSLNKQTVANLNVREIKNSKAGAATFPICTLETCKPLQCGPSLECPTDPTALSACDCLTVDLACPSEPGYRTCDC